MTKPATFALRLPQSMRDAVEELSAQDGCSMNQFIAIAVAERVSALKTAAIFTRRAANADLAAFDQIMNRDGGLPPGPDDQLPEGWVEPADTDTPTK